jgi:hypothetical protein
VINGPITPRQRAAADHSDKIAELGDRYAPSMSRGDRGMVSPCSQPMTNAEGGFRPSRNSTQHYVARYRACVPVGAALIDG